MLEECGIPTREVSLKDLKHSADIIELASENYENSPHAYGSSTFDFKCFVTQIDFMCFLTFSKPGRYMIWVPKSYKSDCWCLCKSSILSLYGANVGKIKLHIE